MFKHAFSWQSAVSGEARLRQWLAARRAHHPLLRALLAVIGVFALLIMLVLGAAIGALMLLGGFAWRLLHAGRHHASRRTSNRATAAQHDVLEGQYRVLDKSTLARKQ